MNLSHYTDTPVSFVRDVEQQDPHPLNYYRKPSGLWVSVDGPMDWREWCAGESYDIGKYRQSVKLSENANILVLEKVHEIYDFQHKFGFLAGELSFRRFGINWQAVAEIYDGIVIAPYQWAIRLDVDWYYPWDCSSGCIWRSRAISSVGDPEPNSN